MLSDFVLAFYGLIALEPLAWSQPNYSIVAGLTFGGVWLPMEKIQSGHIFLCALRIHSAGQFD